MRIAVLDDDPLLLEQIKGTLECHQHVCHTFADGTSLLQALRNDTFDLLIVDWHLPDMEGTDVVQTVRNTHGMQPPILFITRRSDERDVVEALSRGADDFMSKPLRMGELVARATALLRRAFPQSMGARLEFGVYRFDAEQRTLHIHGQAIGLKHREYELALFLFRNAGRLLSRSHLREAVWSDATDTPSRSLDTHMSRLRSKLQLKEANGYTITAVYGVGYRLDAVSLPQKSGTTAPATEPLPERSDLQPQLATS
ncbi:MULTISPECIES: response regulator transcription factor [unclassified Acidovorax]|uniref:response regulator transcription factor n=1 Tax=unclassified Acidovorax TaxID=2684926 RepID=UPI000C174D93|nr:MULTISPECIES: response regulator transcription factor [unclassified Acidovorax]PIF19716.1 DNA-binding response OmpR family regulator [Acidovorax sp. 59]PKW01257.1 DNA-binding response OmpR family regulator [Acidovorax sp. 30]